MDPSEHWERYAVCKKYDPEWWAILATKLSKQNELAQQICRTCPVSVQCDAKAEKLKPDGVIMAGVPWIEGHRPGEPRPPKSPQPRSYRCKICEQAFMSVAVAFYCSAACKAVAARERDRRRREQQRQAVVL